MATDVGQKLDEALVAILSGDSQLRILAGRDDELVVPFGDFGTVPLPVALYFRVSLEKLGALGDTREAAYDVTLVAEGEGARDKVSAMAERVELAVTQPALAAQGLDAAPMGNWVRRPGQVTASYRAPDDALERVAEQVGLRIRITK